MIINNESMRAFLYYMNNRMVSFNENFQVSNDGILEMKPSRDDDCDVTIKFNSCELVEFTVVVEDFMLTKKATRLSEFNGGIIEFATKPAEYFKDIIENFSKRIGLYKQYTLEHI